MGKLGGIFLVGTYCWENFDGVFSVGNFHLKVSGEKFDLFF